MHHLHTIDYAIIVIYLVLITVIGMVLTRRASSSLDHYFLGGRKMPWWLLGVAGMSNWFDLTGTMIITSFLYMLGPRGLYIEFRGGAVLILAFLMVYTGKWHRRSGCMTLAEWMVYRFGRSKSVEAVRMATALTVLIGNIAMMAYLVRGTSLFVGQMVPFSPTTTTILLVGLTGLYTVFAGFYGVVATDLIQGFIIMISCVVVAFMAWHTIPSAGHLAATATAVTGNGQWSNSMPLWHTTMPKGYEAYESLILFASFYLLRSVLAGMSMGYESRYFGARSDRDCGLQSFLQGVMVMFRWPLMIGFASLGVYLVAENFPDMSVVGQVHDLIQQHHQVDAGMWHEMTARIAAAPAQESPALISGLQQLLGNDWASKIHLISYNGTVNPEQILPAVLMNKVPVGLAGFIIVAMLAAMKGTLAGTVNVSSAYFVKDIYQNLLRPKAANRELIIASWISTAGMVAIGLYFGLYAKSINTLWSWILMGLGAGSLIPFTLRFYWWRCNSWGVFGGIMVGLLGAMVQQTLAQRFPDFAMVEWKLFLLMIALALLGTLAGTWLTPPAPMETLRHFYRTTRPFGWWGPVKATFSPAELRELTSEHRNDIIAVPFALLWQVTLFLLPMQLVIKAYDSFWGTLPLFLIGCAGMYWFWYRNLSAPDIPAASDQQESKPAYSAT